MSPAPPVMRIRLSRMFCFRSLSCARVEAVISPAQELRRHSGDDGEVRHILRDDRARADDRAFPDGDAWQQHRVRADIRPGLYVNGLHNQICLNDGFVDWYCRVL